MKGNQFYTVFGIVTAALLVLAGFYCFKSYGTYSNAGSEFNSRRKALERLKESKPYPKEDNLTKISEAVSDYDGEIKGLFQILDRFQQPLNSRINDTQFPQILKTKLDAFKALAKKKGVKIAEEQDFYMAMDAYRTTLPNPKSVPLLDYQLGAIEHLLNLLVEAGVTELITLDRELLPVEASGSGAAEIAPTDGSAVAAKYPVSLTFETNHQAFQKVVNQITNDDKYFFILRALRVDNSSKEGATKGGGEDGGARYLDATDQPASQEIIGQIPPDLPVNEQIDWMRAKGFTLKSSDARILLGDENLRVFMVVDVVRFADASKKIAEAGKGGKEEKDEASGARNKKKK